MSSIILVNLTIFWVIISAGLSNVKEYTECVAPCAYRTFTPINKAKATAILSCVIKYTFVNLFCIEISPSCCGPCFLYFLHSRNLIIKHNNT